MTPSAREEDDRSWTNVASEILEALRNRVGRSLGVLEAERFAASAIRTALRQKREAAMNRQDFICWLIAVAYRKYINALRHAEVERQHQGHVAERQTNAVLGRYEREEARTAAEEEVDRLLENAPPEEVIVLKGKLADKTFVEIADQIAGQVPERRGRCSPTTARNIWNSLCKRLRASAEDGEEKP